MRGRKTLTQVYADGSSIQRLVHRKNTRFGYTKFDGISLQFIILLDSFFITFVLDYIILSSTTPTEKQTITEIDRQTNSKLSF